MCHPHFWLQYIYIYISGFIKGVVGIPPLGLSLLVWVELRQIELPDSYGIFLFQYSPPLVIVPRTLPEAMTTCNPMGNTLFPCHRPPPPWTFHLMLHMTPYPELRPAPAVSAGISSCTPGPGPYHTLGTSPVSSATTWRISLYYHVSWLCPILLLTHMYIGVHIIYLVLATFFFG